MMEPDSRPIDIHRKVIDLTDCHVPFALVLVMSTRGSTPQRPGAKAVIDETGRIWGTVGGGMVEAEARRIAIEACRSQRPAVFEFHSDNDNARESGAICGGHMRILVDPLAAMHRACYAQAADALDRRRRGALLTTIRSALRTEVQVEWLPENLVPTRASFPDSDTIQSCLADGRPRWLAEDVRISQKSVEFFVEPVIPSPLLLIAGGGHVGQALAIQAMQIGFDVTVIDDRPEFTAPALFPRGVKIRCGRVPEEIAACPMGSDTYIVIVTPGHRQDAEALAACIHQPATYIGMIGSHRKVALIRKSFLESGLATKEEFDRIFAPVGLDIGAVTVPEIAASIAAQLIAVRRKAANVAKDKHEALP